MSESTSGSSKNHAQIPSTATGDVEGRVRLLNDVSSSNTEHDTP